jgi:hypothetical protein
VNFFFSHGIHDVNAHNVYFVGLIYVKFEVIVVKIHCVNWDVILRSLVGIYKRFGRLYCLHFQD